MSKSALFLLLAVVALYASSASGRHLEKRSSEFYDFDDSGIKGLEKINEELEALLESVNSGRQYHHNSKRSAIESSEEIDLDELNKSLDELLAELKAELEKLKDIEIPSLESYRRKRSPSYPDEHDLDVLNALLDAYLLKLQKDLDALNKINISSYKSNDYLVKRSIQDSDEDSSDDAELDAMLKSFKDLNNQLDKLLAELNEDFENLKKLDLTDVDDE